MPKGILFAFTAAILLIGLTTGTVEASIIHSYDFTQSYNDILGGPAMAPQGGTRDANGYTFAAGQGLFLNQAFANDAAGSNYTIEMQFEFTNLNGGWSDIINFHNSDHELYSYGGSPGTLELWPTFFSPTPLISNNTWYDLVFNRDGTTGNVNAWLNGTQVMTDVNDSYGGENRAAFNEHDVNGDNIARFFYDDNGGGEVSPGVVSHINFYDQPYTPDNLPQHGVPEPSTLTLAAFGLLGLLGKLRKRP